MDGEWGPYRVTGRLSRGDDGGAVQRIVPSVSFGEPDLPAVTVDGLTGVARSSQQGPESLVLFTGPPGTGKIMVAEALASELSLDLYRIDLNSVVSKFIGETEKNLRRVFDAAEQGGSVLFFDEADALFGRRGEVRDAHDRWENLDINDLFERLERHPVIVIVVMNTVDDTEPGFVERFGHVIRFPDD